MRPNLLRKLKTLALICLFTWFAGIIYQLTAEQRLDYNSAVFGLPLGLVFGFLELFLFARAESRFRQWSFTKMLLFKTVLYTAIIYVVTISITIIAGFLQGHKLSEIPTLMVSAGPLILTVYTLVIYG